MSKFYKLLDKERIINLKDTLVPILFTKRQFSILLKRLNNKKLNINEKVDLYRVVNKRIDAITQLFNFESSIVQGKDCMIQSRIEKAKKLLKKVARNHKGMKILITGSFLWNIKYNDIDVFIFSKYEKEDYYDGKTHINYLSYDAEKSLFLQSLLKSSVANFISSKDFVEKPDIDSIIMLYQKIITLIVQKENYKPELRSFLLETIYKGSGVIMSGKELSTMYNNVITKKNIIQRVSKIFVQTLIVNFNDSFLKKELTPLIKNNNGLIKKYKKSKNLKIINEALYEVLEVGS